MGFSHISAPTAQFLLVDYPISSVVIDVRRNDELKNFGSVEFAFNLPLEEWEAAFAKSETEFNETYQFPKPKLDENIVVLSRTGETRAVAAAQKALQLGYTRVAVVVGGIREFSRIDAKVKFYPSYTPEQRPPGSPELHPVSTPTINYPWVTTEELHSLSKDNNNKFTVFDLRRKDELENFGTLPHSLNLPSEEVIRAAQLNAKEWSSEYGFPKPQTGQPVLFYCRSNRRAKYVYQVFKDAGWDKEGIKVSVFKDGVAGLSRITNKVKAYETYEIGDPLPPVIPPVDPLL